MKTVFIRFLCCVALSYALTPSDAQSQVSTGKTSGAEWLQVRSLSPGEQVQVRLVTKKKIHGSVVSVTDSELVVSAKSGQVNIARSEIRQIGVKRDSARLKKGAIGAAIGAASGVIGGVIADGALSDGNGVNEGATAKLAALGAAIGFGVKALPAAYSTIYKAP